MDPKQDAESGCDEAVAVLPPAAPLTSETPAGTATTESTSAPPPPEAPEIKGKRRFSCPKWLSPWVWQIIVLVVGSVTILAGVIMLVAPGPGMLVIYAGLGILASEFVWARQLFRVIGRWIKQIILRLRVWWKQLWR